MELISQQKALIFRICHVENVAWLLRHGIHCRSSATFDPNYRNIGNKDLIDKRAGRHVPMPPGGSFNDYVPFYFTSRSPMLLNIKTGWNVEPVPMRDIVVMVSSLHRLAADGIPFVFTDRHAYMELAQFSSDLRDLSRLDWGILARSDFRNDPNEPGKKERYQAEALVHRVVPIRALLGIAVYDAPQRAAVEQLVAASGHATQVAVRRHYFF